MKRRVKKKPIIIICIFIILLIGSIVLYNYINYINSNEYKLLEKGYTENEVNLITKNIKNIDKIIDMKYDNDIIKFMDKKYFIEDNLDKYLSFDKNTDYEIDEIIAFINIGNDKKEYEDSVKANLSLNELMLVNKYNYLDKDYKPEGGLTLINSTYAYGKNEVATNIYDYLKDMFKAASNDGIKLIVNSGYRSYESQESTYSYYENNLGSDYATKYVARPGFSEHQTGYVLDIFSPGETTKTFHLSDAYKWLVDNSYKYGFILRYPEDKKFLTGYEYESWHYRFVGIDAAKKIKNENITYEEYYTYYLK